MHQLQQTIERPCPSDLQVTKLSGKTTHLHQNITRFIWFLTAHQEIDNQFIMEAPLTIPLLAAKVSRCQYLAYRVGWQLRS